MDNLIALSKLNWWEIFLAIVLILVCVVYLVDVGKKFLNLFGVKFQKDLDKEADHNLLIATSENLAKLQERHIKDEQDFRQCLYDFIDEQKKENQLLRDEMRQYGQNRANDRQVSIEREKRLNDRIDCMNESDERRDSTIDKINGSLSKLTQMFVDKQINDYRWEIINFASSIADKKPVNKDGFKHCFATYEKYEKILEENNLENGEVEISMEIINEAYKERMLEGKL